MRKITKRSAAVIGATVLAIGGGAAWAAASWFSGTGSASASSATTTPVSASASVVGDKLWPGQKRAAAVTVTNPNEFPVRITGATLTTVGVTGATGCTKDKAALTLGSVPAGVVIPGKPAGSPVTPADAGTWTNFIQMGADADAACAGASFTVNFTLEGAVG